MKMKHEDINVFYLGEVRRVFLSVLVDYSGKISTPTTDRPTSTITTTTKKTVASKTKVTTMRPAVIYFYFYFQK